MSKEIFIREYLSQTKLFILNTLGNVLTSNATNLLDLNRESLKSTYKALNDLLRSYNSNREYILSTTISPFVLLMFNTITKLINIQDNDFDNFDKMAHVIYEMCIEKDYADISRSSIHLEVDEIEEKFLKIPDEIDKYFRSMAKTYKKGIFAIASDQNTSYDQKISKTIELNNAFTDEIKSISKSEYSLLTNCMIFLSYYFN